MEMNVKICDLCKKKVAIGKCFVCKNDVCDECGYTVDIETDARNSEIKITYKSLAYHKILYNIVICKKCRDLANDSIRNNKYALKEIMNIIKNHALVRNI